MAVLTDFHEKDCLQEVAFQQLLSLAKSRQQALSCSIDVLEAIVVETPREWQEWSELWKLLGHHCSQLVLDIEAFQRWIAWGGRVLAGLSAGAPQLGGARAALSTWPSEADVGLWLLDPACRCHALVKSCARSCFAQCLPLKFGFWVDELKIGSWLVCMHVSGVPLPDTTDLRLQFRVGSAEKHPVCVKNTFLDMTPRTQMRRSRSSSKTPSPPSSETSTPLTHSADMGEASSLYPTPEKVTNVDFAPVTVDIINIQGGSPAKWTPRNHLDGGFDKSPEMEDTSLPLKPSTTRGAVGMATFGGSPSAGAGKCMSANSWWKQVTDVCPISRFPICLLPYPPFKLQAGRRQPESPAPRQAPAGAASVRLVDGAFLVVQVLSTMRFEALGQELDELEVQALDQYMKRCRLGYFRLGHALHLMGQGGEQALKELDSLRDKARRKLASLKQIQRNRLSRQPNV